MVQQDKYLLKFGGFHRVSLGFHHPDNSLFGSWIEGNTLLWWGVSSKENIWLFYTWCWKYATNAILKPKIFPSLLTTFIYAYYLNIYFQIIAYTSSSFLITQEICLSRLLPDILGGGLLFSCSDRQSCWYFSGDQFL